MSKKDEFPAELRKDLDSLPLYATRAYFCMVPIDPPTVYGPLGGPVIAYSYRGMGSAIFGYIVESREIDTPEKAASAFMADILKNGLVPVDHHVAGDSVHVGIIHDSRKIKLEPNELPWRDG